MRLHKDRKAELIASAPLFSSCSKKELRVIASIADEIDLRPGKVLMSQGAPGREFFVLLEGEVEVEQNGKRIKTLGAGEFFGEMALLSNKPRNATITALTPIRVLVINARDFRQLLRDDPHVSLKVLSAVADRLPHEDSH